MSPIRRRPALRPIAEFDEQRDLLREFEPARQNCYAAAGLPCAATEKLSTSGVTDEAGASTNGKGRFFSGYQKRNRNSSLSRHGQR